MNRALAFVALFAIAGCRSLVSPPEGDGLLPGRHFVSDPSRTWSQSDHGYLTGIVFARNDGRALVSATVWAETDDGRVFGTSSDSLGRFLLPFPPGTYTVRVKYAGLATAVMDTLYFGAGDVRQGRFELGEVPLAPVCLSASCTQEGICTC